MSNEKENNWQEKTVVHRVATILSHSAKARSSDPYLISLYFKKYYGIELGIPTSNKNVFESIRRARQKIQQGGRYLPPEEVIKGRRKKESELRRFYS